MQSNVSDLAQEIMEFLQKVQIATTNEIGLYLIANQPDAAGYVPSRQQLEIILESMSRDKQITKIKKIKTNYFPEGYEITETRMRSFMWRLSKQEMTANSREGGCRAASA